MFVVNQPIPVRKSSSSRVRVYGEISKSRMTKGWPIRDQRGGEPHATVRNYEPKVGRSGVRTPLTASALFESQLSGFIIPEVTKFCHETRQRIDELEKMVKKLQQMIEQN
jgi:hypothetical protein